MARVPRKGIFAAAAPRIVPPTTIADGRQHRLTVVSSRGHGVAESATFDFGEFADVPLILANERHIRRDIIAGKPGPSLRIERNGLRSLARFPNLRVLDLSRTAVTSAGVAQLRGLARLEALNLTGTRVDEKAADELRSLPALKKLWRFESGAAEPDGAPASRK